MLALLRKVPKALNILQKLGVYSGLKYILLHILEDTWLLGKVIELRGNTGHLDGATFYLDSPYIATRLKSRFLLRTWEIEARSLIKEYLPYDVPLIEFGSCIGVVSCITNKLLARPEDHIVVEANKNLVPILEMNREKNDCRFKIINAAIAYGVKEITFYLGHSLNVGSISNETSQSIAVSTTSLEAIIQQKGFSKVNLICDIEGAEIDLLSTEGDVISKYVEWIVMEMHGQNKSTQAHSYLESLSFALIDVFNHNRIYHNQGLMTGAIG